MKGGGLLIQIWLDQNWGGGGGGGGPGGEGSDDLPPAPHVSSPRNSRNAIFLPTNIWLTYTSVVIIA